MDQIEDDTTNDNEHSYADLPMEIILNICDYLNSGDKKAVSTTCRRWYEAFIDPKFQSGYVLKFSNVYLSDNAQPVLTYLNCFDRPFLNVCLHKAELGTATRFFEHIGTDVEELTIDDLDISEHQLTAVLKNFRRLKRLTIKECPEVFMSGQFLKSDADKKALFRVFNNLKSLSIQDNRYLTDAVLCRIVSITPHLQRLDLSSCPIAFHNALCRRFYPQTQTNEPSESILTFQFIREVIEKYSATLTELDLNHTLIGSAALESLSNIDSNWHLEKLILRSCLQLTLAGMGNFLLSQPKIVNLDLSFTNMVAENWASTIIEQLPDLQVLNFGKCKTLTDGDCEKLAGLKSLRVLDISYCKGLTNAGITQGIAKQRNETLDELNLSGLNIGESCLIDCTEKFPNLRSFQVAYCVTAVTDATVQMIIKNLKWLRFLNLEQCSLITDTGLTGIQCTIKDPTKYATISPHIEFSNSNNSGHKISLRSRAEDDIVADAQRKLALLAIIEEPEMNIVQNSGYSIKLLKSLRTLNLSGCTKISDISLKYGFEFCELSTLELSSCQQISFSGIQVLTKKCQSIENLHLMNCCNINDLAIELIAMKFKRLHFIDIRGCRQLTQNYINDIHFHCKVLTN